MKEITRISLAALPYNIEVTAKKDLEKYLHAIENALGADADAMKEIESRIAELFSERGVLGEKVISAADVTAVKQQLGDPKEFIDDAAAEEIGAVAASTATEKRLMRDTNNQLVGGVCSGLAAYFRVDTVWMRVGMVVMTFLTSGAMIPTYLIMWLVMPPARTAAERLQMQGKPVTLEAIQEESVIVAKRNDEHNMVLTMLRIMAGIGLLIVAAVAIMGLVTFGYHVMVDPNAALTTTQERALFGALLAAGVTFIIFCVTIARALFTNRYTKRFWITLGILSVLGVGFFSTGVLGYGVLHTSILAEAERSNVTTSLDAEKIAGIKGLVVDGDNTLVHYVATTDTPKIEVRYSKMMSKSAPKVEVTRTGDVVSIGAFADKPVMCMGYCQDIVTVMVYGPALTTLTVQSGSARYETNGQDALALTMKKQTDVAFVGTRAIQTLNATVEESSLATTEANVVNAVLHTDSASNIALGNVAVVDATVPETCSSGNRLDIAIGNAKTVKINGVVVTESAKQTACMNLAVDKTW